MFKPFAITRSNWVSLSICIVPTSDVRFVGRVKQMRVRVRFVADGFDRVEDFWTSSRTTREAFVSAFVEDRASEILKNLEEKIE